MPDQESPCAQRLEGAVVRGHRAPGEAERRSEESAALVEHALLDDLVRLPEHRRQNLEPRVFAVLRLITSSNSRGTTRKAGRDVVRDWDRALAHERDGRRVAEHAVARAAAWASVGRAMSL